MNTLISRISHDLINPLGGVAMLLDQKIDSESQDIIKESINHAMQVLDIIRSIFSSNLTVNHAEKIIQKINYIELDFQNTPRNLDNLAQILLTICLVFLQKQKKGKVIVTETMVELDIIINEDELSGLFLKNLSSYSCYFYLIGQLSKDKTVKYENQIMQIIF
ncbi:hypothetical protein FZC35_00305 [Candidatus Cytomitobacter indipagum]|uniref:Uncharacterized protein n=1 Tax=Candidatus Cytomitobacter indipagum TaxID=2601575 RepID=A0A5C0UDL1_9PROT|nr:hypothetical protein [Candidatus Cytomitobacter indipagum]QEK37831.1 hypothetical protein FZC35_00305 [Candidatus Cytomitobacter indipagum]